MQTGYDRATGVARFQLPQRLPGHHHLARPDTAEHRLVRRTQAAGMVHAHDAPPRDAAGVDNHAATRCPYDKPFAPCEIHPAVAGQPRSWRRREGPHHHGYSVQRPRPDRRRRRARDDRGRGCTRVDRPDHGERASGENE